MSRSIFLLSMAVIFTACYTGNKAQRRLLKAHVHYPELTAALCSSLYPPLVFEKDSVIYKPAIRLTEYVYADCDSFIKTVPDNKYIKLPCPMASVTDTILIYKEKQVVNRAEAALLTAKLDALTATNARLLRQNKMLRYICLILGSYTLLRCILRVWKINLF